MFYIQSFITQNCLFYKKLEFT